MLRADGRSAFTLAEVIVALTVTCIVAALISTMLVREQRTHVGLASLTELRAQLRQGAEILASELRNISVADGDIVTFSTNPPVLEMIAQRGVGVVCAVTAPNVVALPPSDPREGKERLAWLARNPSGGMALQLLNDAGTVEQADDSWHTIEIESASTAAGGCASSEFAGAAAATGTAQAIRLRDSLPAAITAGTAWRLVERVRYSVYKSGGDWFLGYCASNSISIPCGSPQPVAGPFIAPNKDSAELTGFRITLLDGDGAETVDPQLARAAEIVFRGETRARLFRDSTGTMGARRDSVKLVVAIRGGR